MIKLILSLVFLMHSSPSFAVTHALCELAFTDRALHTQDKVIQMTLAKVLSVDFPIFFSGRFNRILTSNLITALRPHQGNFALTQFFDSNHDFYQAQRGTIKYSADVNDQFAPLGELICQLRKYVSYREVLLEVASNTFDQLIKDLEVVPARVGADHFIKNYPGFTDESYLGWQEVAQVIAADPVFKNLTLEAIIQVTLTMDSWAPRLRSFHMADGRGYGRIENQKLRAKEVALFLGDLRYLETPSTALAGMPTLRYPIDFARIEHAILNQQKKAAIRQLKAHDLIARDEFELNPIWPRFNQKILGFIRDSNNDFAIKRAAIRATGETQSLLGLYLNTLTEEYRILGLVNEYGALPELGRSILQAQEGVLQLQEIYHLFSKSHLEKVDRVRASDLLRELRVKFRFPEIVLE